MINRSPISVIFYSHVIVLYDALREEGICIHNGQTLAGKALNRFQSVARNVLAPIVHVQPDIMPVSPQADWHQDFVFQDIHDQGTDSG